MSEADILRYAVGVLCFIATAFGSTIVAMIVWHAKSIMRSIEELGRELKTFDRRVTRLEAKTRWRIHHNDEAA